ncbi:MAG: hypothetical protein ACKO2P_13925, partial [Planctomycetota bacterium]
SGQTVDSYLALSPCHQFLVILTDDATLWSWNIAQRQFIDGIRLQYPSGEALKVLGFRRPGEKIITAPNGHLFILTAPDGTAANSVQFDRIQVSPSGQLSVTAHLSLLGRNSADCKDLENCVRCFLPDLQKADGSADLVIGWDSKDQKQAKPSVRVVTDFIPPSIPHELPGTE